jgi:hypothetical protein
MYDQGTHTEVESFILKWTIISSYTGVALIFTVKILGLLSSYVTSGKVVTDFGSYIWKGLKVVIFGG